MSPVCPLLSPSLRHLVSPLVPKGGPDVPKIRGVPLGVPAVPIPVAFGVPWVSLPVPKIQGVPMGVPMGVPAVPSPWHLGSPPVLKVSPMSPRYGAALLSPSLWHSVSLLVPRGVPAVPSPCHLMSPCCPLLPPRHGLSPCCPLAVPAVPMAFGVPWHRRPHVTRCPHIRAALPPDVPSMSPDVPPMSPGFLRALWG